MLKLAVFDCDGTLVDSQFAINACMADAFTSVGYPKPDIADVRKVVGLPLVQAIEMIANDSAAPAEEMAKAYSQSWGDMRAEGRLEEPLYDGINAVLDDSTVVQVTKLYNRKIQFEAGTVDVETRKYNIGPGDENDDTAGTATVPVQD